MPRWRQQPDIYQSVSSDSESNTATAHVKHVRRRSLPIAPIPGMKGGIPDNRTVKRFLALLRDVPPGVTSLQLGDFRVEFAQGRPVIQRSAEATPHAPTQAVPLVPGTPFPDDDSRIDAADLYLADIELDMTAPELS